MVEPQHPSTVSKRPRKHRKQWTGPQLVLTGLRRHPSLAWTVYSLTLHRRIIMFPYILKRDTHRVRITVIASIQYSCHVCYTITSSLYRLTWRKADVIVSRSHFEWRLATMATALGAIRVNNDYTPNWMSPPYTSLRNGDFSLLSAISYKFAQVSPFLSL